LAIDGPVLTGDPKEVLDMATTIVMLSGGPNEILETYGTWEVDDLAGKLKIQFGCGYEHYTHNGEFRTLEGEEFPVFQWCQRTRVAE